ncbi:FecCD family ABC transporter permease [Inquilinus sp.]|jgi:ABC-type Fe3+-siderophore transport system permease subunit|uniref:FecCD family ABC transporter permease n=1 Tax=Inquilinus sp. TaxID=1932117 RepID=UPI0037835CEA
MTAATVRIRSRVPWRVAGVCALLLLLLAATGLASIALGAVPLSIAEIVDGLSGGRNAFIVMQYRVPRILVSILAGAALAVAGMILQGVVRNPLASPDVVGITKGAGLGALLAIILLPPAWQIWAIPVGVLAGAALAAGALLMIGRHLGGGAATLALVGVAIGALAQAAMQFLMVRFPGGIDQSMVWLAGSVYGSTMADVRILAIWLAVCLPGVLALLFLLDLTSFGDDTLTSLGQHPIRIRAVLIVLAVMLTAGAVASVGSIGFLGLLAPHLARILVGPKTRHLLPATALMGALVLCVADLAGRLVALPNEIPAGIVASVIGGPYLLFLLLWDARHHGR